MKASRVLLTVHCLVAVCLITGTVESMKSSRGSRGSTPSITTAVPTTITATEPTTTSTETTIQGHTPTTQSVPSNQQATTTVILTDPDPTIISTTPPALTEELTTLPPLEARERDQEVTLVMGVVGGVVGLLLLIVIAVCAVLLCTAASSYQKIKTGSGQNNIERSGEYGNKKGEDVESVGTEPENHIYHVLESTGGQQTTTVARHSYEIVDGEDSSSAGEVSLATTTTSCSSLQTQHTTQTDSQKSRGLHHQYEIVPSFTTHRARHPNYDHLSELESPIKSRRHSLNDQASSCKQTTKTDYDTLEIHGAAEKRKSEYSSLDDSVHGYAVLRPHSSSSATGPTGGSKPAQQDGQYSHLIHH